MKSINASQPFREGELFTAGGGGGLVFKSRLTLVTPQTVARQASLSMGFSKQEYWRGLSFLSPGALLNPRIEPVSPALQADFLPLSHQGRRQ